VLGTDFKPDVRHANVAGGFDTHWLPPTCLTPPAPTSARTIAPARTQSDKTSPP